MKWINSRFLFNMNQDISAAACSVSGARIYSKVECFSIPQEKGRCSGLESDALRSQGLNSELLRIRSSIPNMAQFSAMRDAISNSFPDYEFSSMTPEHFQRITTPEQARSTLAWNMSSYLPENEALSHKLWNAIENEISPAFCDIYTYEPNCSDVFTENGALWAKVFLFVNEKARKVLLFHIREGAQGFESESEDETFGCMDDIDYRCAFGVF